jgi:hypothetical protein
MKLLENVEYLTQRDNKFSPSVACFPTSAAIAIDYLTGSIETPDNMQLEDYIVQLSLNLTDKEKKQLVDENGSWILNHRPFQVIPIMEFVCRKIYKKTCLSWNISYQDIIENIDKNRPVVCLGDFRAMSFVKGHYNCVIGYDEDTKSVWTQDPYGNAHTNYSSQDGNQVFYDWSIFERTGGRSYGLIFI